MHVQINEQTAAFIRGFRSIVHHEWLAIFSTPEVQRLISGDTLEVDLEDLRCSITNLDGFENSLSPSFLFFQLVFLTPGDTPGTMVDSMTTTELLAGSGTF